MNTNIDDFKKLKIVLILGGYWKNFDKNKKAKVYFQNFRHLYLITLTPLTLVSMLLAGFRQSINTSAFWTSTAFMVAFMSYSGLTEWNLIDSISRTIVQILHERNEKYQIEMFKKQFDIIWKVLKIYMFNVLMFVIFYEISPFVYDFYLAFATDSEKPFRLAMPDEGFIGQNPKRGAYYYSVSLIASVFCFFLNLIGVGFGAAYFIYVGYACVECRIVHIRILEWGKFEFWKKNGTIKLDDIIREHQRALKLTNEMKLLFGAPLAAQNQMGSLSLTIYAFTIMVKLKTDFMIAFINIFCFSVVSLLLIATNYLGEKLQTEGSSIFESLTEIPWHEMPPHVRKELNMMIRQAKRSMVISYKGKSPQTLSTLMRTMNSSYSYFMVLRSMR